MSKNATYKEIQKWVKQRYGFVPKTCWIAHVKELSGLPVEKALNRIGTGRTNRCPLDKIQKIQAAFRHFGLIQ